jgi:hypothetical protein
MADIDKVAYKFPDEQSTEDPSAVNASDDVEIEVIDDTPSEDRGRKPMKDAPVDISDDELEQYSEGVKKRIQHFTKGYHEERRAKEAALREKEEAIRLAQNVWEENKRLQGSVGQGQAALIEQAKIVVNNEIEEAKRKYKAAYEAGDSDALIEAQDELTNAKIKIDKVNQFKPALQEPETVVQPAYQPERAVAAPQVDAKARAWQDANPWFGDNEEMTAIALTAHKNLVDNGIDPTSDEYYERINSRVRKLFPENFDDAESSPKDGRVAKKSTVVASATRSTAPRKIVLTQSQVTIAKRLGVPLELYAKQVAEQMRK